MKVVEAGLRNSKNIYLFEIAYARPQVGISMSNTHKVCKGNLKGFFIEEDFFDAIIKWGRPYERDSYLLRAAYDQVVKITHTNKPLDENGQPVPGAKVLYEDEGAYATIYTQNSPWPLSLPSLLPLNCR